MHVLAAARILKNREHSLSGSVAFLFQPAEEGSPDFQMMQCCLLIRHNYKTTAELQAKPFT